VASHGTVGIGAAARLLGTTQRALRYYEQRGLLPPAEITAAGHRRYDDATLCRARRLLALRELGLSLATIGKVLAGDGQDDITAVLTNQALRLDAEVSELISLRERITRMLTAAPVAGSTDEVLNLLEQLAMKIVLSRIYTRTGDDGTTALAGGSRVDKTDPRLKVMGDVDELVSAIGVAIATPGGGRPAELLRSIQNDLFDLGADLAATGKRNGTHRPAPLVGAGYVARLERACDDTNADLEPPASFVLPGSNACSAALHHARAICRRAERHAWTIPEMAREGLRYLNRLSDLLFILARATETDAEPTWAVGTHQPD
jgi:cob(I)alamin adenosyltransferase